MTQLDIFVGKEGEVEYVKEELSDGTRSRNLKGYIVRDIDGRVSFRQEEGKFIF